MNYSIIIPVYNEEKLILDCLNSLQKQIYKDFEVIFVDNNSTDRSIQIIKEFSNISSFPIKITTCQRQGISYARNKGAEKSSSKYLVFFDADGEIHRKWMKRADKILKKNPSVKVIGGFVIYKANTKFKKILYNSYSFLLDYFLLIPYQKLFKKSYFFPGNNMLIAKELFIRAGKFPHIVGEDLALSKRIQEVIRKNEYQKTSSRLKVFYSSRRFDQKGFFNSIIGWAKDNLQKKESDKYDIYR